MTAYNVDGAGADSVASTAVIPAGEPAATDKRVGHTRERFRHRHVDGSGR